MPRRLLGVLFLLLVSVAEMQAQGEVVLHIGDNSVSKTEFQYYYRKSKFKTPDAYLPSFVTYKLKVLYAKDCGLDTLPAFDRQLKYYQNRLLKDYLLDAEQEKAEAKALYERGKQRLPVNDYVRLAHISKYLPQNLNRGEEQAAKQLMDSIYAALKSGADFAELARQYSDDAESREKGGILPWLPVNKHMQEWIDQVKDLEKEKISVPFYSPMGIHIVKWIDRKPYADFEERREKLECYIEKRGSDAPLLKENWNHYLNNTLCSTYPELTLRMQEVHDALLASGVAQKFQSSTVTYQPSDLEAFFKQHRSNYAWDMPHYKGAVIYCKDKKAASVIKKHLKKKPWDTWKAALTALQADNVISSFKIEIGLFSIGQNKCIDKLVFKCGSFDLLPDMPYVFVMGKKLKKGPDTYDDVKEDIIRDYRAVNEEAWMKELRRKYKVEINQEALKTVNNDGSN